MLPWRGRNSSLRGRESRSHHTEVVHAQRASQVLTAVELTLFITTPYWADNPGKHPYYLHALPDLRDARVHLERRDTDPVDHADKQTIEMIDVAMADIRRAPRLMTERTLMITSRSTSNSRARTAFTRRSSCSPMPSRTWRNRKIKQTRAGYWRPAPARRAALLRAIQWAR